MRSVIELIISLSFIFGGGRMALIKAHDTIKDMAMGKIVSGLSSTEEFNKMLWKGGK